MPIKLGRSVVGCIEVANKGNNMEFTDQDQQILGVISESLAGGLISHELKLSHLKREIDDEQRYVKGQLAESYNTLLAPVMHEVSALLVRVLGAEKVVLFLHNKDIDHLYSFHPGA